MFKLRLIYGLLFGALLLTMFYFDQTLSAGWPARCMSFPPGTLMAVSLIGIIPLATAEMRRLLKAEGVAISMRVCVTASILCMIWPWLEQLSQMLLNHPKGASPIAVRVAWLFHTVKPH